MTFWMSIRSGLYQSFRMLNVTRSMSVQPQIVLDPKLNSVKTLRKLFEQNEKLRKAGQFRIPENLLVALDVTFDDWSKSRLARDACELNHLLALRALPLEPDTALPLAAKLEHHFANNGHFDNIDKLKDFVRNRIRLRAEQWFLSDVSTRFKAAVYTMARFPTLYSTSLYCLNELKRFDPDFSPNLVLDHGCGPAAAFWSMRKLWPKSSMYYLGIERSPAMQNFCSDILRAVTNDVAFGAISFRSYLSTAPSAKYSLVISNHSLLELPSYAARFQCIMSLWRSLAVGGYLVLIESGNDAGYRAIIEARSNLLARSKEWDDRWAQIVAPCPHHRPCPRVTKSKSACHFQVSCYGLRLSEHHDYSAPQDVAKFSYLIVQKLESGSSLKRCDWPCSRVVQPVLLRKKCVICRMCSNRGRIEEFIAAKSKCSKSVYRLFRESKWGDLIPVQLRNRPAESLSSESLSREDSELLAREHLEPLNLEGSELFTLDDSESLSPENSDTLDF